MSKLVCGCGHTIVDQSSPLSYKASLLPDVHKEEFFDWLVEETQSYVEAAQSGAVDAWLLEKGYGSDYVALKLNHGHVLHDHILGHYLESRKDVYLCTACGRLHIEKQLPNMFASYSPDSLGTKDVFVGSSAREP